MVLQYSTGNMGVMNCLSAFSPCTIQGVHVGYVPYIEFLPTMTHVLLPIPQVHVYVVLLLHIKGNRKLWNLVSGWAAVV